MTREQKRLVSAIHRWLGIASALFLLVLALSGLMLNHAGTLGLHTARTNHPLILKRYGMQGGADISSYRIGDLATLTHLAGGLYLDGQRAAAAGVPERAWEEDGLLVVAAAGQLVYLTKGGELVEQLAGAGRPDTASAVELPLTAVETDPAIREAILTAHQGEGVSLYRVLLDLHSGRLFGWGGRTIMDLTALAILLLVSTGISGWLCKPRQTASSR